jgi:hypothetical protein
MRQDLKVKLAIGLGALLSVPVVRGALDGTISTSAAAIRVGIAMAFAYAAVSVVAAVVTGYLPKPTDQDETTVEDGVEDAVLVDEVAPEAEAS